METTQKSSKGFKVAVVALLFLSILLGAAIAAVALNPTSEDHRSAVSDNVGRAVNELVFEQTEKLLGKDYPSVQRLAKKLGGPVVEDIVGEIAGSQLEYHDYVLFSTTTYTIPKPVSALIGESSNKENATDDAKDGDVKTISVGVYGKVFTADKDKIKGIIGTKVANMVDKSGFIGGLVNNESNIVEDFTNMLYEEDDKEKVKSGVRFVGKLIEMVLE